MMKTLLFRPFERYSSPLLITIGILATMIGIGLSFVLNTRFDGALDFHISPGVTLFQSITDSLIVVTTVLLLLYSATLLVNTKTRFIDVLSTTLVSRIPMYLLPLFNIGNWMDNAAKSITSHVKNGEMGEVSFFSIAILLVIGILSLAFVVWHVALLYNGYKVASNAKGIKPVILFILVLLFAEIATKIIIHQIN